MKRQNLFPVKKKNQKKKIDMSSAEHFTQHAKRSSKFRQNLE